MTKIYGTSDDLVEIEGDINEEFDSYDKAIHLEFDDGTELIIAYSQSGEWLIDVVNEGSKFLGKIEIPNPNPDDIYTEYVLLDSGVKIWDVK